MFSNPLIEVSIIELLRLWGELVEAYHDKNGFGGNVAEIYAYRFQRYSQLAHLQPITKMGEEELHLISIKAGNALIALVEEFCSQYHCKAMIDEIEPDTWCRRLNSGLIEFNHRVHVTILI